MQIKCRMWNNQYIRGVHKKLFLLAECPSKIALYVQMSSCHVLTSSTLWCQQLLQWSVLAKSALLSTEVQWSLSETIHASIIRTDEMRDLLYLYHDWPVSLSVSEPIGIVHSQVVCDQSNLTFCHLTSTCWVTRYCRSSSYHCLLALLCQTT
jgi:hypothetical protein